MEKTQVKEIVRMRNHFSSIFEQMWSLVLVFVAIIFSNEESLKLAIELFLKGQFLQGVLVLGGSFILLIIILAFYINRWYRTTITVKDGVFTIEQMTLTRKVNNIAVSNISNINLEQNLFEMVMGTYKLKLDTDSMSTANETDVQIILKKDKAYAVKNLVIAMMKEQETKQQKEIDEELRSETVRNFDAMDDTQDFFYDIIYSTKDVVKNCIMNTSVLLFVLSIVMLVCCIVYTVALMHDGKGFYQIVMSVIGQGALFLTFASTIVNAWLNDFRFRATRQKDKIYVSCGLLKRKKYAIPIDRINAVVLRYSFIGRLFHCPKVELVNVGGQGQEAGGKTILLAASYEAQKERLKILLPEYELLEVKRIKKQPKKCMLKEMLVLVFWLVVFLAGFIIALNVCNVPIWEDKRILWIIIAVVAAILLIGGVMCISKYNASGLLADDRYLVTASGTFAKTVSFIPYSKIQTIRFISGPIERLLKLNRATVHILGSLGSGMQVIEAYEEGRMREVQEQFRKTY